MDRGGWTAGSTAYNPAHWREHGIPAHRFVPCPHCGGAVAGRERRWKKYGGEPVVFFEAHCLSGCGWHYFAHEGSRDDFVEAANRRYRQI